MNLKAEKSQQRKAFESYRAEYSDRDIQTGIFNWNNFIFPEGLRMQ